MPGRFCCGDGGEDGPAVGGSSYMWCVTGDWCAYVCVGFIYLSLLAIDITTTLFCIIPMYSLSTWKGLAHLAFFQSTVFMVVYSHLSASWADPGLVGKDTTGAYARMFDKQLLQAVAAEKNGDITAVKRLRKSFCKKCSSPKPEGSHHCSICHRCVRKMDHHCPWVNNCVGERNLKSFLLFLCYVTIGTGYAMVMYALRAHQIITSTRPQDRHSVYTKNVAIFIVVSCIVSFIVAVFFFAFVMCMFYDQYEALTTGVPGVDAMQISGDIPRKQSCWYGLKTIVMFNEPLSWRWFIPVAPKIPQPIPPLLPQDEDIDETAESGDTVDISNVSKPDGHGPAELVRRFSPPLSAEVANEGAKDSGEVIVEPDPAREKLE